MTDAKPGPNIDSGLERFWRELQGADPERVCPAAGVAFENGQYEVPFLGSTYSVQAANRRILGPPGDSLAQDPEFGLMILGYLTRTRQHEGEVGPRRQGTDGTPAPSTRTASQWVSERQLPGGDLFFQGPHALPLSPIVRRFGQDAEGFRRTCSALGGTPLPYGDAAFALQAMPRVPLALILWLADDEFPARAGVLFDPSAAVHLPLDLILGLVRAAVLRLEAAAPPIS